MEEIVSRNATGGSIQVADFFGCGWERERMMGGQIPRPVSAQYAETRTDPTASAEAWKGGPDRKTKRKFFHAHPVTSPLAHLHNLKRTHEASAKTDQAPGNGKAHAMKT